MSERCGMWIVRWYLSFLVGVILFFGLVDAACFAAAEAGSGRVPQGMIAHVSHVPDKVGTIVDGELARAVAQVSVEMQLARPPKPGDALYKKTAQRALEMLLDAIDTEGEARELGVAVSRYEVSRRFRAIKRRSFTSEADYHAYLRKSKLSEREAQKRVELLLLTQSIQARVVRGVHGLSAQLKVLRAYLASYVRRWRNRTVCAPEYATDRCSNGPSPQLDASRTRMDW